MGGLGIRCAHLANIVMLGKLIWSLLHDRGKFWVHVLTHKYLRTASVLTSPVRSSSSSTRRAIYKMLGHLKEDFRIRLGVGNSSFCDESLNDEVIWSSSLDGSYSASSWYSWLVSHLHSISLDVSWNWIWRLHIPLKVWLCLGFLADPSFVSQDFKHWAPNVEIFDQVFWSLNDILRHIFATNNDYHPFFKPFPFTFASPNPLHGFDLCRGHGKGFVGKDKTHFGDLYASEGISLRLSAGGYP
ncbi:hypothetical protein RIF29_10825 [Crotalaria pallida]|uniref:Uncharacterized protein n=1 Tax=Crotalaria pallida TaxID=3830 RepID=A0AAN9FZ90_CROPI